MIQTSPTKIIYLSDISASTPSIMDKYKRRLSGSDCLIINAPFFENQPGRHIGVREAIRLGEDLDCKKLVLSHINHHNTAHRELHAECAEMENIHGWPLLPEKVKDLYAK